MSSQVDFDVAIVGCGPVGATLANFLGQYGLRVGVFEREESVYHSPRASHLDGEVMRMYQMGGLAEALQAITMGAKGYHFLNPEGQLLMELLRPEGSGPHGWAYHYRFHQPVFEEVLRSGLNRFPLVEVFLSHEVIGIAEQENGVVLDIRNMMEQNARKVTAAYVVGCDGARSLVRCEMKTNFEDLGQHQPWLVVDIELRGPADLPDIGIQYCNPARPITFIPQIGNPDRYRWEIMIMPGDDKDDIERPERVWELLNPWVTPEQAELVRASVYTFHAAIAQKWRCGRLLLAGDAAHLMPPFLGQGLCAGVRDAANLAWKLAMVSHGKSPDTLLDSYEQERAPHVRAFTEMAMQLGEIIAVTDHEMARERDRRMLEGPPQAMTQPAPALGPGLHGHALRPAGVILPQPQTDAGRLLDDVVGPRFAVVGDYDVLRGISSETKRRWEAVDAVIVTETGERISRWLQEIGTRAVILRPDRYVLGTADSSTDLDAISERLPVKEAQAAEFKNTAIRRQV